MDNIGERIRYLRLENEMTLEELGNLVGVGKSTVRKWETGIIENMRRDKIVKLSKALKVTPEFLMGWTPKTEETERMTDRVKTYAQKISNLELTDDEMEQVLNYAAFIKQNRKEP